MINFLLMITWFPACVIIWERSCYVPSSISQNFIIAFIQTCCSTVLTPILGVFKSWPKSSTISELWCSKEKYLLNCVINLRYLWITLLFGIAAGSIVIVLYNPKLELPDSQDFQLFTSSHPFEQYDFVYKDHFWFHRESVS